METKPDMFRPSQYYPWLSGAIALLMTGCSQADDPTRLLALQALEAQGIQIIAEFDIDDSLRAFAGSAGGQPIAVYVTPDGNAIVGTRVGSDGTHLDERQLQQLVAEPLTQRAWSRLEASGWVQDGDDRASRIVYTFSDPNCPYCNKFWEAARPWVEAGEVQLRHVMVGMIRADSASKAAAILEASNPSAALKKNEAEFADGGITPAETVSDSAQETLAANQMLMMSLGFRGTPGIVAKGQNGSLQTLAGLPQPKALLELFGPFPDPD